MSAVAIHPEAPTYWLAHCEGFRVDAPGGRLGRVEAVVSRDAGEPPQALVIRGGMLGGRLLTVPIGEVDTVVPRRQRIRLRSTPQVGGIEFLTDILGRAGAGMRATP